MNREEKAVVIDQIAGELGASEAIIAMDYRGITVAQVAELREKLRVSGTKLRVTKNSLSERAADQAGVADIKPLLVGPTALALVKGDVAVAAKVLSDTSRALRGPLIFKGGFMGGSLLTSIEVETIARLPSRDVLNAQLVGTIAAPLTGLARTLNALIQGVASQLGQIRDQGLVSGEAPAVAVAEPPAQAEPEAAAEAVAEPAAEPEAAAEPAADAEPEAAAEPAAEAVAEPAADAEPEAAAAPAAEGDAGEAEVSETTEGSSDDEPSNE
jgi:large subunit ribosomal protein L10